LPKLGKSFNGDILCLLFAPHKIVHKSENGFIIQLIYTFELMPVARTKQFNREIMCRIPAHSANQLPRGPLTKYDLFLIQQQVDYPCRHSGRNSMNSIRFTAWKPDPDQAFSKYWK